MNNEQQGRGVEENKGKEEKNPQPSGSNNVNHDVGYERTAFKNRLVQVGYKLENCVDVYEASEKYRERIKEKTGEYLNESALVIYIIYKCKYIKYDVEEEEEEVLRDFYSGTRRIFYIVDFDEIYQEITESIKEKIANFMAAGSNWILDEIQEIQLNIAKYTPL